MARGFFWASFVIYSPIVNMIVEYLPIQDAAFDCSFEAEIGCRLRRDYSIALDDTTYTRFLAPAAFCALLLYAVGVPAVYLFALRKHRSLILMAPHSGEDEETFKRR